MIPNVLFEPGGIRRVGPLLREAGVQSLFLVTGRRSFHACGAEAALEDALRNRHVVRFYEFESNPKLTDVEKGLEVYRRAPFDILLAIGGGTVLDMAKLIAALSAQSAHPRDVVLGRAPMETPGPPVMAVPTTAGTGSEVTHFAAVYVEGRKFSLAHPSMRPAYAIVDPELTYSMSAKITAVTGLDAFSQAVESMWSVQATAASIKHSREAIRLVLEHLPQAVHHPTSEARHSMSRASHLSGKAIDTAKTTAPHAISYTMTSHFHVPHGHAAALTLGPLLAYNSQVTDGDCMSDRGADHVKRLIAELNDMLSCPDAPSSRRRITELIESLGLPSRLSQVGIRTAAQRRFLIDNVDPERLLNNPRKLTSGALAEILEEIA